MAGRADGAGFDKIRTTDRQKDHVQNIKKPLDVIIVYRAFHFQHVPQVPVSGTLKMA
jgi:hypothetical protein